MLFLALFFIVGALSLEWISFNINVFQGHCFQEPKVFPIRFFALLGRLLSFAFFISTINSNRRMNVEGIFRLWRRREVFSIFIPGGIYILLDISYVVLKNLEYELCPSINGHYLFQREMFDTIPLYFLMGIIILFSSHSSELHFGSTYIWTFISVVWNVTTLTVFTSFTATSWIGLFNYFNSKYALMVYEAYAPNHSLRTLMATCSNDYRAGLRLTLFGFYMVGALGKGFYYVLPYAIRYGENAHMFTTAFYCLSATETFCLLVMAIRTIKSYIITVWRQKQQKIGEAQPLIAGAAAV